MLAPTCRGPALDVVPSMNVSGAHRRISCASSCHYPLAPQQLGRTRWSIVVSLLSSLILKDLEHVNYRLLCRGV